MIKAVAIGELLIDFNCVGNNKEGYPILEAHPGGAPGNFLAAMKKYGADAAFIGKVGDDAFGRIIKATLEESGIDCTGVVLTDKAFTTLAFVVLDEKGDRDFSFARKPGADTTIEYEEVNLELIEGADLFHFGTLSLTDEPARTATMNLVEYARNKGILISCDPNLRKPLWKDLCEAKKQMLWAISNSDVVKISDDEIDFLFGLSPEQGSKFILENYPSVKLVFATCGEHGSFFTTREIQGFVPVPKGIKAVDTCGAGDIFGGSAMYALLSSGKKIDDLTYDDIYYITKFACTAATLSTRYHGGIGSIPDYDEVVKFCEN